MRIALKYLDEIITLIRNSPDADEAKTRLMSKYKLSDVQAQAILDMPLRRLAALERKKIEDEYKEVMAIIKTLEELLASPKMIREYCVNEQMEIRQAYAEKRKTQIIGLKEGDSIGSMLTITDVTPSQEVVVAISEAGLIARTASANAAWYSGKEAPYWLIKTDTHQTLYLVSDSGKTAAVPVHSVPEAAHVSEGVPVHKISPLSDDDPLGAVFSLPPKNQIEGDKFVLAVTRGGMVKKTLISELPGPSSQTFMLCKVNDGDSLGWALLTDGQSELLLSTGKGMCIRFKEEEVRPMGLIAAGVNGMKLGVGDELVGASLIEKGKHIVLVCSDGKGKRVDEKDFPMQGRYGQGVIGWKLKPGTRMAGATCAGKDDLLVIHFLKSASKQKKINDFPIAGRAAGGKDVVELKPGDQVIELTEVQVAWETKAGDAGDAGKKAQSKTSAPAAEKENGQSGKSRTREGWQDRFEGIRQ